MTMMETMSSGEQPRLATIEKPPPCLENCRRRSRACVNQIPIFWTGEMAVPSDIPGARLNVTVTAGQLADVRNARGAEVARQFCDGARAESVSACHWCR